MTSIAHSTGVIVPLQVNGYEATRDVRTIVHPILNRSSPDVTFRAPGLRSGTLSCLFADEAAAVTAYGALSVPQVLVLSDADVASIGMSFVVGPEGEQLTIGLDPTTRRRWLVTVPFVEVTP
ncbi:hypothetical protein [Microbacterium sp. NPDC057650]|uniref:hypothetical protein n=1 Tax=unclassified Microbacterium TaxID=2609290 RepID=UPI00366BD4DF